MNQKSHIYRTSINCGGCVKAVTPFLNEAVGEEKWAVDTENPDKLLQISNDEVGQDTVIRAVREAGFEIQPV